MLTFKQFISEEVLTEATKLNMHGKAGADGKALGHVRDYVMPLLSSAGRSKTVKALKDLGTISGDTSINGSNYSEEGSTHKLSSAFGDHDAGTQVRVTHVTAGGEDGRNLIAHTTSHGKIPLSKLMKPESLRKVGSKGQAGFDVEKRISDNLGTEAAGSSAVGFDFHWADKDGKKVVRGKTKIVETVKSGKAVKGKDAPDVRGESKLSKGKFGQSVVSYQDGKWGFRNSSKMNSAFEKSNVVGPDGKTRTILEHLNKYHKDGKISKGFTARAAAGTARQYLSSSDINTLHVHHREKDKKTGKITIDRGTTYTIGNTSLKGKTNLGHLSEEDIGRLDGSVNVQASGTGRAEVTHRPSQSIMKELAGNAHGDKAHMHGDLSNADHASQFVEHVKKHIAKSKKVKR